MPEAPPKSPSSPERPPSWGVAALFLIVLAVVVIVVASRERRPLDHDRDPLELSSRRELTEVVSAVSGVVRVTEDSVEETALRRLEALHPISPGAADLRESCLTTYRGAHDAQRLAREMRARMPPDGGPIREEDRRAISQMLERSQRLVTEARESHLRCVGLYEAAARRVGVEPARRPR